MTILYLGDKYLCPYPDMSVHVVIAAPLKYISIYSSQFYIVQSTLRDQITFVILVHKKHANPSTRQ
jgi:hypothetical protein